MNRLQLTAERPSTTQKATAMTSPTTNPSNSSAPLFTLFSLLPVELQDQIWDHAAAVPQMHFLLLEHDRNIFGDSHTPYRITLHPESGVRTQSSLSSVCHAAQDAVDRQNRTLQQKTTIAGTVDSVIIPGEPVRQYLIDLDLQNDLVCFGPPESDWFDLLDILDLRWSLTPMISAVRKFAMRLKPGWGRSDEGRWRHGYGRCSNSPYLASGERFGLCSGCVLVFLREFTRLEEFYFILDEADVRGELGEGNGDAERHGSALGKKVCNSYSRTYFLVDVSRESAGLKVATMVLDRLKSRLVSENGVKGWGCREKSR